MRKDRVRGWETQGWATFMLHQQDSRFGPVTCSKTWLSKIIPDTATWNLYWWWESGVQNYAQESGYTGSLFWFYYRVVHRFHNHSVRGENQARDEHRSLKPLGELSTAKCLSIRLSDIPNWTERGITWSPETLPRNNLFLHCSHPLSAE